MVEIEELQGDEGSDVDYAATADAFFERNRKGRGEDDDDDSGDDDDDSEEEEEEENDNGRKNKAASPSGSEEDSSEDSESESDSEDVKDESNPDVDVEVDIQAPDSSNGEPCTFDLRNLLAMNTHQIDTQTLYNKKPPKTKKFDKVSIDWPETMRSTVGDINEEYLLEKAMDGCAQLVGAMWQLPKEKSDAGAMVKLPLHDESRVPRALPPPEPKKETKWEKFAKERGIPLNKNKRSQKVWDEATGTWMFRHGYNKANNDEKEWPIMEVKANEDPYADPWERQREAKRVKVEKNTEQRMRNQERAGVLAKGTTTRFVKSQERARKAGKEGGNKDRDNVDSVKVKTPSGVPVDLTSTKVSGAISSSKRGKDSTMKALLATQRSTASMGRFDKMREDEPERRKTMAGLKKRKFESATGKKSAQTERERSLKVLKSVVDGGGATKERDIRKGKYARGETAYDYEFNDGLGASSFKKKKGRAGGGKAKKMTKKRVK